MDIEMEMKTNPINTLLKLFEMYPEASLEDMLESTGFGTAWGNQNVDE